MAEPIIEFLRDYIAKDYDAVVAKDTERDEQVFQQKLKGLQRCFGEGINLHIGRPAELDEEYFEQGEQIMAAGLVHPRTLFQIKEYLAPPYRNLYRAYLSRPFGSDKRGPTYVVNYYIIPDGDTFKIISLYDFDIFPDKRGLRMTIGGLTWLWSCGVKLHALGILVKCWKFQAPTDSEHLAEYESE